MPPKVEFEQIDEHGSMVHSVISCSLSFHGKGCCDPSTIGDYTLSFNGLYFLSCTVDDYKRRWEIEVLFQCLKSRGFNFEETHLKAEERLKRLFAVLARAFCWAYHVGAWRHVVKPIRIKKHERPARSILRHGFDWMRHVVLNPDEKCEAFTHILTLLWNALTGLRCHVYQL